MELPAAVLEQVHGQGLGRRFELGLPQTLIGRSNRCDVQLGAAGISRRHARIDRRGDLFVVVDLGSRNGTFVHDRPAREVILRDGDLLKLGPLIFCFHLRAAGDGGPRGGGPLPTAGGAPPSAAPAQPADRAVQ